MDRASAPTPSRAPSGDRAGERDGGEARAPLASSVLALQRTAGNAAVGRLLARKHVTVHLGSPPPVKRRTWIERASPENEGRARKLDELEKLTDAEIKTLRDQITAKAMGPSGSDQEAAMRTLENIESVTADRGIAPRAEHYSRYPDGPVGRRMNVRAHIEADVRRTGSFAAALKAFATHRGIESDIEFFEKDRDAFAREFKSQARSVTDRMLDGSQLGIKAVLESYGLPYDSAWMAAKRLRRHDDTEKEADHVIAVALKSGDVDKDANVKRRFQLAQSARELERLKQVAHDRKIEANKASTSMSAGNDAKSVASQQAYVKAQTAYVNSYNELRTAWIAAERLHPVLTGFRGRSKVEDVDLSGVNTTDPTAEMKAVLMELLPKLSNIADARGLLRSGKLDPLTLPSVVAVTRSLMFVPPKSIRDGIVNDLAAEAADDASSWLITILGFALAIITLIPSAGASLAIPAGMAAVSLAAYSATREWDKYTNLKTYANTDIDIARSLSMEDPSLTGFALSLVNMGLEAVPLVSAFNRARKLRTLVAAGEDTTTTVRELNRIGATAPNRANANARLGDDVLADIQKTTKAPPPKPVSGSGSPPSVAKPKTEEQLTGSSAKKTRKTARPYNVKPTGTHGSGAPLKAPPVDTLNQSAKFANHQTVAALRTAVGARLGKLAKDTGGKLNPMMKDIMARIGKMPATANNKELLKQFPLIYKKIRDPKFVEDSIAELWEEAARRQITTRAALEGRFGGEAALPKLEKTLDDDAEAFRQLLLNDRPFLDRAFTNDFHGAHAHLFQEFMIERAFGAGAGARFRKLIAGSTGTDFVPTGGTNTRKWWGAFWDGMFDDLNGAGHLNHPETIGRILQEDLGLPRYAK
jgi:hypothetical protein